MRNDGNSLISEIVSIRRVYSLMEYQSFVNWNPYRSLVLQGVEKLHMPPPGQIWSDPWWDVNKLVSRGRAVATLRSLPCCRRCEERAGEADSRSPPERSWTSSRASRGHIGFYGCNPEYNPSPGEAVLKSQWIQDSLQRRFLQPYGCLWALEVPSYSCFPVRRTSFAGSSSHWRMMLHSLH